LEFDEAYDIVMGADEKDFDEYDTEDDGQDALGDYLDMYQPRDRVGFSKGFLRAWKKRFGGDAADDEDDDEDAADEPHGEDAMDVETEEVVDEYNY
jgi:hypothetical protein